MVHINNTILGSYSFFYPDNSIREEITHNYAPLEGGFYDILKGFKEGRTGIQVGIESGKQISGFQKSPRAVLIEEPTYFQNSEKRKFDFTIQLYNTSDNNIEDIYKPISWFKQHSHGGAAKEATVPGVYTIGLPNTFTIRGGLFDNPAVSPLGKTSSEKGELPLNKNRVHLVLTNMVVEYNSEMKSLDKTYGLPVQATLTLSFQEIRSLLKDDWNIEWKGFNHTTITEQKNGAKTKVK